MTERTRKNPKDKKKSVKTLLWHFKLESCQTYDLIKGGLTIKESKIKIDMKLIEGSKQCKQ